MHLEEILNFGIKAVNQATKILNGNKVYRKKFKKDKTLVSNLDIKIEREIAKLIKSNFKDHKIFGEEVFRENGENLWLIDPIDGTANFLSNLPFYSTSLAFQKNGETLIGVVKIHRTNEIFYSIKGKGAFLNNKRIRISNKKDLDKVLVSIDRGRNDKDIENFNNVLKKLLENKVRFRIFGSVSCNICYTACSRFDASIVCGLEKYDLEAALLIAREANCEIKEIDNIKIVGNSKIVENLCKLLF